MVDRRTDTASPVARASEERMPQLDGLRAVAVILVIAHHYLQHRWPVVNLAGRARVIMFFVLSGFLITGMLLRMRAFKETGDASAGRLMLCFYARRLLRIGPLFYAVLGVMFVAGDPNVTRYIGWHVAYLSNVLFWRLDTWPTTTSHLWSLAVEWQFYLVWPIVVLFAPRRLLVPAMLTSIVAAPAGRLALLLASSNTVGSFVLPIGVSDSLGLGALLAYASHAGADIASRIWRAARVAWAPGLVGFLLLTEFAPIGQWHHLSGLLADTCLALVGVSLVSGAAAGYRGAGGRFLQCGPVAYIGKISYGMYLWHLFVPFLFYKACVRVGLVVNEFWMLLAIWMGMTVALSAASGRFLERPLYGLKRWLPYRPSTAGSGTRHEPVAPRPSPAGYPFPAGAFGRPS